VFHEQAPFTDLISFAAVVDQSMVGTGNFRVTGMEGADTGLQTVATFIDPAGPESLDQYSADIAWGDGGYTPGTITFDGKGTFTVKGSHVYEEEGAYTLIVYLHHDEAADSAVMSTAVISDPAVLGNGGYAVLGHAGQDTGVQQVADFVDPGSTEPVSSYAATLDWGDGTTSDGTVAYDQGFFTVSGGHTYKTSGTYRITVTIHHESADDTIVFSEADIDDGTAPGGSGHGLLGRELAVASNGIAGSTSRPVALSTSSPGLAETNSVSQNLVSAAGLDVVTNAPAVQDQSHHVSRITILDNAFMLLADQAWDNLL
jgi:hypothetical protein